MTKLKGVRKKTNANKSEKRKRGKKERKKRGEAGKREKGGERIGEYKY